VLEHQQEYASQWAAIVSLAGKFGPTAETLRGWVRRAEIDEGRRPGLTSEERVRLVTALVPVEVVDGQLDGGVTVVAGGLEARYHLVVGERERARAQLRLGELQATIEHLDAQLAKDAFLTRARPEVVANARRRLEEARYEQAALRAQKDRP